MRDAQSVMSSAASNYDVPRLFLGTALAFLICVLSIFTLPSLRPLSSAGIYYFITLALYGVLMFASSYVEEEHNFWYWITSGWFFYLFLSGMRKSRTNTTTFHPALVVLIIHRLVRRWNQTGQKFSGADDIVTSGIFHGNNSLLLWVLVGATYLDVTNRISKHVARSVVTLDSPLYRKQSDPQPLDHHRLIGTLVALPLCATAFIFKLAFTAKDAPELTYGITPSLMAWVETFDLVMLAQTVFGGVVLGLFWMIFTEKQRSTRRTLRSVTGNGGKLPSFPNPSTSIKQANSTTDLAASFFDLLTLFLLTQTKAQNIPLYLLFRIQFFLLCKAPPPHHTLCTHTNQPSTPRPLPNPNNPNHPPPQPNLLLRPRPQQQHIQHRPLQRLQRHKQLQRPGRRPPRLPVKLVRPRVLERSRRAAPRSTGHTSQTRRRKSRS